METLICSVCSTSTVHAPVIMTSAPYPNPSPSPNLNHNLTLTLLKTNAPYLGLNTNFTYHLWITSPLHYQLS